MKKFMKRNIKVIVAVIITTLIVGTGTVYATYSYLASNISFTPTDSSWEVTNVEDALNDLYDKTYDINFDDFVFTDSSSFSYRLPNRQTSIELTKGKYIIISNGVTGYAKSSKETNNISESAPTISHEEQCTLKKAYRINPTGTETTSSKYYGVYEYMGIWTCEFNEDVTLTSTTWIQNSDTYKSMPGSVSIHAIKIS